MKLFILCLISLFSVAAAAQQRIVQTDSLGNKLYHKQQYTIVGNKICPSDSLGNIEHHKGCLVITDKRER